MTLSNNRSCIIRILFLFSRRVSVSFVTCVRSTCSRRSCDADAVFITYERVLNREPWKKSHDRYHHIVGRNEAELSGGHAFPTIVNFGDCSINSAAEETPLSAWTRGGLVEIFTPPCEHVTFICKKIDQNLLKPQWL